MDPFGNIHVDGWMAWAGATINPTVGAPPAAWVPRPYGIDMPKQRAMRRGLRAGYGAAWEWTREAGSRVPGQWLQLAEDAGVQWLLCILGLREPWDTTSSC